MSKISNNNGRGFEYACIIELKDKIEAVRPVVIDENSVAAARRAWNTIDCEQKKNFIIAADAFINTLFAAEPLILECDNDDDIVILSINSDADAEAGDVRDVVITRGSVKWDVGLSMKHNHFATKHSRLSKKINFGEKWYGIPCDTAYSNIVNPIFEYLDGLKEKNIEWNKVPNKSTTVYIPILNAFMQELKRAYEQDNQLVPKLISYLLGIKDYYKVVAIDNKKKTEFQTFNLRGDLNQDGKMTKATLYVPIADLPTEIIELRMKPASQNTVELYLNNGWSLSFRIHSASTIVEPSLKFDIQFLGVPTTIITINCFW